MRKQPLLSPSLPFSKLINTNKKIGWLGEGRSLRPKTDSKEDSMNKKFFVFHLNLYGSLVLMVGFIAGVLFAPLEMVRYAPVVSTAIVVTGINWMVALACDQHPHRRFYRSR